MPHYKDTSGNFHFLDSSDYEYLLPDGCVPVTDEEVIAAQPVPPNPRIAAINGELAVLDMRKIRPIATGDIGFLATLNAQSDALRAELKGLIA